MFRYAKRSQTQTDNQPQENLIQKREEEAVQINCMNNNRMPIHLAIPSSQLYHGIRSHNQNARQLHVPRQAQPCVLCSSLMEDIL